MSDADREMPSIGSGAPDATTTPGIEPPWTLDTLVERLVAARRGGPLVRGERVASALRSSADAYVVQGRVAAVVWPGDEPTAWKVGADSRDALPVAAPMMPALVVADGGVVRAPLAQRIVEAEVAYRFGADLPPRDPPYTTDEVAAAVASMHAAIEVVASRIADFPDAPAIAKLADHQVNGAFALGDGVAAWKKIDLRAQPVTMTVDGRRHESATGSHGLGNPAVLLPWFVAHLGRLPTVDADGRAGPPRGVKAGDVVTTGTWTKPFDAKPGQRVEVEFPGIGRVALTFAG